MVLLKNRINQKYKVFKTLKIRFFILDFYLLIIYVAAI